MKKKHNVSRFLTLFLISTILCLGFISYSYFDKNMELINELKNKQVAIDGLNSDLNQANTQIKEDNNVIIKQTGEINKLKLQVKDLEVELQNVKIELSNTQGELKQTTQLYEEAQPYQERVERGQRLDLYYSLLSDYEDYGRPIILKYLGLSAPKAPANDDELWERGRLIYKWIADNYKYCGDKGLRVGSTFYEFQFFSPDELLMSDNARCGDCDDFATLFAGLMYASGVPYSKVFVACGTVEGGGHCWNWLKLSQQTYRIDPVCSDGSGVISILGFDFNIQSAYYTSTKKNVQCQSNYNVQMIMNPAGYYPQ